MTKWLVRPWKQCLNFKGRATRREFWLFWLQILIAYFAYFLAIGLLAPDVESEAFGLAVGVSTILTVLFVVVSTTSALVRRLHDHDKSGWVALLTLIPAIGWIYYLIITLTPGTRGENEYGYDPRAGDQPSTDELASVFS